jgi:multiple sugar transport system permease protein
MAQATKIQATTSLQHPHNLQGQLRRRKWLRQLFSFAFILPAVALVVGMFWYSVVFTLALSFTDSEGLVAPNFIGFANYANMVHDPAFATSIINTCIWVVGMVILPVGIGLAAAIMLQNLRGQAIFKNVFYLPYAIGLTSTGVIWTFLLSNDGLPTLLATIGLKQFAHYNFLTSVPMNTFAMIIVATWQGMGTNMLLFLVGLNGLDRSALEAARLDGAGGFTLFRYVTFPLLQPVTTVIISITLVNSLQTFNLIWVMTQGGPYNSSSTLALWMYTQAFALFRVGYGSAIAIVLMIIVLLASTFYLRKSV